jgi:hypothetical protein
MRVENLVGQQLAQYELRALLGAGGMGAVYRAYQTNLKRGYAVQLAELAPRDLCLDCQMMLSCSRHNTFCSPKSGKL